jgi:DNA-binding beta-propeller fold protein YncE
MRRAPRTRAPARLGWLLAFCCATAGRGSSADPRGVETGGGGGQPVGAPADHPHARPAALAVDAGGTIVYVALSTADRLMALDVSAGHSPRVLWERPICAHPTALAALPGRASEPEAPGGVLVSCRFEPELRLVTPASAGGPGGPVGGFEVRAVPAGPTHGHRGLAVDPSGRHAYVASAALGGVKVIDLRAGGRRPGLAGALTPPTPEAAVESVRFRATGIEPTVVRVVSVAGQGSPLLVVANRVSHTVTVHRLALDGGVSEAIQTIRTEAPVLDVAVAAGAMYLLTYEDRPVTRARRDVEGLDSVILVLPPAPGGVAPSLFGDPGLGRRRTLDLSEWPGAPVVDPEAAALWSDAVTGTMHLAVVGAGTDNLWISADLGAGLGAPADFPVAAPRVTEPAAATQAAVVIPVGTNPSAVAVLPDGRLVTADRLSDTVSLIDPTGEAVRGGASDRRHGQPGTAADARVVTLPVGDLARSTPAELGEVLFYSRALVPHNTAAGALSLYTCASCHVDGHVDGRRHPSKFDRFASMTKSCRGLAGTEPFLSLGRPATLAAFADNIINTHAQGSDRAPATFDRYDVALRLPAAGARAADVGWTDRPVGATALRAALASYLGEIPLEPSPFVAPGRSALTPPERRGLRTFRLGCAGCHRLVSSTAARRPIFPEAALERALLGGRVALTAAGRFDVGTPMLGAGGNNPPSLHGVWSAAPYFSDGSATSLEEVLARTDPGAPRIHAAANARAGRPPAFSSAERADLLAFLRAL